MDRRQRDLDVTSAFGVSNATLPVRRERVPFDMELRREPSMLAGSLDEIAAPAVILDRPGRIVAVNRAWRELSSAMGAQGGSEVGADYVSLLGRAHIVGAAAARDAADGIRAVLARTSTCFTMDYPAPTVDGRWFSLRVSSLGSTGDGAIVTHLDITDLKQAESRLLDAENRPDLLDGSWPIFFLIDRDGVVQAVSDQSREIFGLGTAEVVGASVFDQVHPTELATAMTTYLDVLAAPGRRAVVHMRARHMDGRWHDLEMVVANMLDDPAVNSLVVAGHDVSDRRRTLIASRLESRLLDRLPAIVVVTDESGVIVYWNARAEQELGYTAAEVLGRTNGDDLDLGYIDPGSVDLVLARLAGGKDWEGEYDARRADGSTFPLFLTLTPITDEEIGFKGIVAAAVDISERRNLEERLAYRALHDQLTGLPNRSLFLDRVEAALARRRRTETDLAVLFIDLDDFKAVNDRLGPLFGDEVLCSVATLLQSLVREGDTVARLAGDEFVVCLEDLELTSEAVVQAEAILAGLAGHFHDPDGNLSIGASIGIALATDSIHAEAVLRNADAAMYRAKERGKNTVVVFDESSHERALRQSKLGAELANAFDQGEIEFWYQPELELRTGRLFSFEALARWNHPERGMIPPLEFIPLAEQTGLISAIGSQAIRQACAQVAEWGVISPNHPISVAVNVSALQLADNDLLDVVAGALTDSGIDPALLCLEITESVLMEDAEAIELVLASLKSLGITIAVDDFGTGYSSLSRLKGFPVDFLKIDRSFVDGLGRNPEDLVIAEAVVNLAHTLGLQVIAEGIETAEQLRCLNELDSDYGQGWLWDKAVPAEEATAIVRRSADFDGLWQP